MSVKMAVIGGTGVYDPEILEDVRVEKVDTPFGCVEVFVGRFKNKSVAFLARHGQDHSIPPHKVNYRANIFALKELGVKNILATAAVGSLNPDMKPTEFVFADQFLDFTKARAHTFFGESKTGVVHLDMTQPYCPGLRQLLLNAASELGMKAHAFGTYVCTEGPRFETPAEIKMFKLLGGDLVGMTSVPECPLAREAEMCYATVAFVTNFAAGISPDRLSHQEVVNAMAQNAVNIRKLIMRTIEIIDAGRQCVCQRALQG